MTWYTDPRKWDVYLAADGPSNWARVDDGDTPRAQAVPQATVSNVHEGTDTIDFDVDRTGTPILVKTSYFPSWKADGAEGPFRVTPNLMVVVPTSNHVQLQLRRRRRSTTSPTDSRSWASCSWSCSPACGRCACPSRRRRPSTCSAGSSRASGRDNDLIADFGDDMAADYDGLPVDTAPSATLSGDREPPPDDL